MKVFRVVTLVLLFCAFGGELAAQPAGGRGAESAPDPRLALEQQKAKDDRDFEQKKLNQNHAFEREKLNHPLEWLKALAPAVSILVTVLLAGVAYWYQSKNRRQDEALQATNRREDAALQFQLKAAEIVMDSRDSNQAKEKAQFLRRLFGERLTLFDEPLKQGEFPYFGRSIETREELLKLLAQYPESRREILRAWEILFPWDSAESVSAKKWNDGKVSKTPYKWFDELRKDEALSRNKPPPATIEHPPHT